MKSVARPRILMRGAPPFAAARRVPAASAARRASSALLVSASPERHKRMKLLNPVGLDTMTSR